MNSLTTIVENPSIGMISTGAFSKGSCDPRYDPLKGKK